MFRFRKKNNGKQRLADIMSRECTIRQWRSIAKLFTVLLLSVVISWCSWVTSQVEKQIKQSEKTIIEKQEIIQIATEEKLKNERIKNAGKAYLDALKWDNAWIDTWIDTKKTKVSVACIQSDTINIFDWFAEDYKYESDCWAFIDYGINWCNINYSWEYCLLNEDPAELNRLLKF